MMPGCLGLDAVRAIRADPALAGLPVILLTARAQESDVEPGFDSGADDYITKPFSPRELRPASRHVARRPAVQPRGSGSHGGHGFAGQHALATDVESSRLGDPRMPVAHLRPLVRFTRAHRAGDPAPHERTP